MLAEAFPASTFVDLDLDAVGLARGRACGSSKNLPNVAFERCDATELRVVEPFGVVFVFNAARDQVDPGAVLCRIREALVPGGIVVTNEPCMPDALEDNLGNPMAPFTDAASTLHCMIVSLAHGGAGLGTAWGEQAALRLLREAGPRRCDRLPDARRPGNAIFAAVAG